MPILTDLASAGAEFAGKIYDKNSGKWFDKVAGEAQKVVDGLDKPIKDVTQPALDVLISHKDDVIHLGQHGLTALMGYIALGNSDKATELLYLTNKATLQELLDASDASTKKVIDAKKANDEAKKQAVQILKDVGLAAAKSLLPVLMAI